MKSAIICLACLSLIACLKKNSDATTINTKQEAPIVKITPTQSADALVPIARPEPGVFLGPCVIEGTHGTANGIEVTAKQILLATALYSSTTCTPDTLSSWGYTTEFASFSAYAADIGVRSRLSGDEVAVSFDKSSIKFLSKSGIASSLQKSTATLVPEQRLKIYVMNPLVDTVNATVSGQVLLAKGPLNEGEYDMAFYCEGANKKVLRQELSFATDAMGITSFLAKLNTLPDNHVPQVTRCQITLAELQRGGDSTQSQDIAWSQFLEVK